MKLIEYIFTAIILAVFAVGWAYAHPPGGYSSAGDMTKTVYDTNNDGTVDSSDTATALAVNPDPCGAGDFVTDIDADGTLTCDTPAGGTSGPSFHVFLSADVTGVPDNTAEEIPFDEVPLDTGSIWNAGASGVTVNDSTEGWYDISYCIRVDGLNLTDQANANIRFASDPTGTPVSVIFNSFKFNGTGEQSFCAGGIANLVSGNTYGMAPSFNFAGSNTGTVEGNATGTLTFLGGHKIADN